MDKLKDSDFESWEGCDNSIQYDLYLTELGKQQILENQKIVERLQSFYDRTKDENWSNSMSQHDWIMRCLKEILEKGE